MKRPGVLLLLTLGVVLAGCGGTLAERAAQGTLDLSTLTATDFRAAAREGATARAAGQLPAADRWPECFALIADKLEARRAPKDAEAGGVATLVMRAHIAKAKSAEPISAECAQVLLQLEADGVKLGAALFPGGGLLGKIPGLIR